jgi:hypothetical protein
MIRRGFWLTVGAVGGIMGYRRVARLLPRGGDPAPRPRQHPVRETIRFTRDVREGMDLYIARHPRRVGPTLGANARTEEKDVR